MVKIAVRVEMIRLPLEQETCDICKFAINEFAGSQCKFPLICHVLTVLKRQGLFDAGV